MLNILTLNAKVYELSNFVKLLYGFFIVTFYIIFYFFLTRGVTRGVTSGVTRGVTSILNYYVLNTLYLI